MKLPVRILALFVMFAIAPGMLLADSYRQYYVSYAVDYAERYYDEPYGSSGSNNRFHDYGYLANGGNCTNFVSQAIMAGLVRSTSSSTVFSSRYDYDIDASSGSYYRWYFRSDGDKGPAFTGAHKLHEYAKYNYSHYKGLHFAYVTHSTPTDSLDCAPIQVGDVVFADWEADGRTDHSMLVTDRQWYHFGCNKVRLTYQGSPVGGKIDVGLGDIDTGGVFYVYRPLDYNPSGL